MLRTVVAALGLASLVACLAAPILCFIGAVGAEAYKHFLAAASVAWFVFATTWSTRRGGVT